MSILNFLLIVFILSTGTSALDMQYQNNFFVLMSASKFFFNYRHSGNVMAIYKHLKKQGVPDDRIILMLPENHACSPKNMFPGTIEMFLETREDFYCDDVEVDYKSDDLTYETILNFFRGRYPTDYPENMKLQTDANSRIFIYWTGHGGDNFFKIQDTEVLQSADLAKVFEEMHLKRKYKEIFFLLDTCEAMSMFDDITAPNMILMGTSLHDQPAKSYQWDRRLNSWLNDHFTFHLTEYLRNPVKFTKNSRLNSFISLFPKDLILSDVDIKSTLTHRALADVKVADYLPLTSEVDNGSKYFNIEGIQDSELLW